MIERQRIRIRTETGNNKKAPELTEAFLIGAGEEIRTLDPNLGKVMLYP
jgi:hypothetical protein